MSQARDIIHEYPVQTVLTSSPQSTVYRSEDPATNRQVAVKLLTSLGTEEDQIVRQHYLRAMGAVQFLRLAAFPEVLDFGFTQDNSAFVVMEWVDGVELTTLVGASPERTLPLLLQIVEALEALGMGDVYHLNLSPNNILVTGSMDGESAKIVGFGTAVYLTEAVASAMLGHSPDADQYMAPERMASVQDDTLDERLSDLYSLALIIAEVLEAQVRSLGSDQAEVRFSAGLRRELDSSAKLESLLNRALRPDPRQRDVSYPELKAALVDAMPGMVIRPASDRIAPPTAGVPIADFDEDELNYDTREIEPDELPPEDDEEELEELLATPEPPPMPSPPMVSATFEQPAEAPQPPPPLPAVEPPTPSEFSGPPPLPGDTVEQPESAAEPEIFAESTMVGSPIPAVDKPTPSELSEGLEEPYAPDATVIGQPMPPADEPTPPPLEIDDLDEETYPPDATVIGQPMPPADELAPPPLEIDDTDEEPYAPDATVIGQPMPPADELTTPPLEIDAIDEEPYPPDATVIGQPMPSADELTPPPLEIDVDLAAPPAPKQVLSRETTEPASEAGESTAIIDLQSSIESEVEAPVSPEELPEEPAHLAATVLDQPLPPVVAIPRQELEAKWGKGSPEDETPQEVEADEDLALAAPPLTFEKAADEAAPQGTVDAGAAEAEERVESRTLPPAQLATAATAAPPPIPPADRTPQVRPEKPDPTPVPEPQEPAEAAASSSRGRLFLVIGLAAAAVIVIAAIGITFLWRAINRPEPVAPTPVPVVALPTPIPPTPVPTAIVPEEPTVNLALEEADALLFDGDVDGARELLAMITPEQVAAFSAEETEIHQSLVQALKGSALDGAIGDLVGGLEHGSIRMLKRAVASLDRIDASEYADRAGIKDKLETARTALELHQLLWTAHNEGNNPLILEHSAAMIRTLPGYSTPYKFRDEAAQAIEAQADASVRADNLDGALNLLAPLQSHWPDRKGLSGRVASINSSKQGLASQQATLDRAMTLGRDGDPKAGIAVLDGVTPIPKMEQSYQEARKHLEALFADLDAQAPQVSLAPGTELIFKKKKVVTVAVVITDDNRVTGTAAFIRVKGESSFKMIPLNAGAAADQYLLELTPAQHLNDNVSFYIEALDESGHTGRLGSADAPLLLKRKRLFGR